MRMTAQLGWVIAYVPDVVAAVAFYERSFGLERSFVSEGGDYGELNTGQTKLAFASEALGDSNFAGGVERPGERPGNVEIVLVFDDPAAAFARAVDNGATPLAEPEQKPWGQLVGYLRDPFGTLVEIASPVP
jgi:lactoylglutathione lyase